LQALGQLAAFRRQQTHIPVIGLTGSCGKTTTKSMIASILQLCGPTLATEGTLNNDIGVPITLMRLTPEHQYAVIEMGANHQQEIRYVTQITRPDVALITNVAPVHIEGFGGIDGIAKGKAEIFEGLTENGVAILNADDHYVDYWRELLPGRKIIYFGMNKKADVTAKNIQLTAEGTASFELVIGNSSAPITLNILGAHNVMNALAAAAATKAIGIDIAAIQKGLLAFTPVNKRLVEYAGFAGAQVIDDSYNANPTAFLAVLQILQHKNGEKILIMGDMKELGEKSEEYHRQLGYQAREHGISKLYAYGQLSALTVKAFGKEGHHFSDQAELIAKVKPTLHPDAVVLVKGSRSMKMERIVEALKQQG
jgi:UDP-N-acetylmuramoyl-tripeptide--D-alanyl-D-alanine ligase